MAVAGASRGDDRPRARLLERDGDLSALASVGDAAASGNGRFVVIEGRAGVGKTSLLTEARQIAAETGLRVLGARCSELEQDFAFGVVRQLFEPLLTAGAREAAAPLFTGAAGLAAPLFDPSAIAATEQSGDTSFAILHGLYWLAANAALSTPTALLLDDVHWCDRPSLRWLLHLVPRLDGLPLLLAVATRPPLQARESALLTDLIADPAALLVRPSTLGAESVASLAREALGSEPDEGFRAACSGATGGNPLLLRALLDALAADGVSPSGANAPRVEAIGPEPVARMVSRRLSGLSSDANALVRAVAVLDHAADPKLASELAGIDEDAAGAAITALADAEILHGEPRLEFAHPIIRTSVYEQLGATERTAAHRRAAALLIAARAEPEQAAAHLLAVAPEGDPAMVVALRSAAERALARGAATTAIAYLRRALSEAGESAARGTVLAELGMAERGADLAAAAAHLREAVELSADAETRAQLALECGRALYFALDDHGAREVFTRGIELLGSRQEDLRELLEAELMHVSWFVPELYSGAPERLTRIDPESLAGGEGSDLLLAVLAYNEARLGRDRARCVALAERALRGSTLEEGASFGLYYALLAMCFAGELETATTIWNRALSAARRRGDLLTTLSTLTWRGFCALRRGELRDAESDVREGLELGDRTAFPPATAYTAAFLAEILTERGEFSEAESVLGDRGLGERVPENVHFSFLLAARGKLHLVRRRPQQALTDFTAAGEIARRLDVDNPAYSAWRSDSATALLALGRTGHAQRLAEEELDLARRWNEPRAIGIALRTVGLACGGPEQENWLREAVDVLSMSSAPLEHAKALVELGAALRRANKRSEARELLRLGVGMAHRSAATALAERGNEELAATGARPRKLLQTGPESLTASERRVARLAADEMTNKEIAQALFITVKTVEVHLSSAYRKLDVSSRRQLAIALAEPQALVPTS